MADFTRDLLDATGGTVEDYDTEIEKLLADLENNDLATTTNEERKKMKEHLLELKKKLSPFGRTIEGKKRYLCASIVNVRDEYQTRFLLTGIIGYLRRALDEWRVPESVPAVPVYDYFKDPNILTPPKMADGRPGDPAVAAAYNESREFMKQRLVVAQFLEDTLLYNPDEHVRSAYQPNPKDPERKPIGTAAAQLAVYQRRLELQRKKKKDLAMLREADNMVEYIDRVLYAVQDEDYKNKLIEMRKERFTALETAKQELDSVMKTHTIVEEKVLIGRDGEKKNVRTEREMTPEEQTANFKRQQEICVLLGKLTGDINVINERIQRIDEWWEHQRKKKAQEEQQPAQQSSEEEVKHSDDMIEIDGVVIPKQPKEVMDQIEAFQKRQLANSAGEEKKESDRIDEQDQDDVTRDTKPIPIGGSELKPGELIQKVVIPNAHVLPESIEERKREAHSLIHGESMEVTGKDDRLTKAVTEFIPAADIFNKLERYFTQNFEQLRMAVNDLYAMKSDCEFAINPFDMFDTEEAAADFTYKHRNDVITSIVTCTTNVWNIMGSFKKNRERIRFYNENTSVLEAMADEVKRATMLGQDIMSKRRRRKRRENKAQDGGGGNDEKFKEYQKMNAPHAQTEDDIEDPDMPDNTVAVPIINISDGGRNVKVTKIYTQAEAPTHMLGAENSTATKTTKM